MIVLRPENFGGIIFNSKNAHEIWVDKNSYQKLKDHFSAPNKPESQEIKKIYDQLGAKGGEKIKILPPVPNIDNSFPFALLNSPVLADINITNKCNLNCPHCYVDSNSTGREMSEKEFDRVLEEIDKNNVLQVAIGGGEPTTHPLLPRFLKKLRQKDIVPNLTTNGKDLKWKTVYYMTRYCGAVALSIEEWGENFEKRRKFSFSEFLKSVKKIKSAGLNLVFQIVVSKNNLATLPETVARLTRFQPYGFIFLAYKPQGRGENYDSPLSRADQTEVQKTLKEILHTLKGKTKTGFDCCFTPALMDIEANSSFIGCSAGRSSLAIMPDLNVLPCSFMENNNNPANLHFQDLHSTWKSNNFHKFRQKIYTNMNSPLCSRCDLVNTCLGACPEFQLVKCNKTS